MKKLVLSFLSFLMLPMNLLADDACTNPDEYTIDQRCYVTDEQKKEMPYNATVSLETFWGKYCTGSIAKWNRELTNKDFSDLEDSFYLFTAKHCTDNNNDNVPDKTLKIKLQNGNTFRVALIAAGNYDIKKDDNWDEDWAIYRLPVNLIKDLNDINWVYADADGEQDGRSIVSVGYGTLKIMSDKDIEDFQQRYLNYLKRKGIDKEKTDVGVRDDNGVYTENNTVIDFINSFGMIFASRDLFMDNELLKFSRCYFSDYGYCQGWGGDSGGPSFDNENRLVGIAARGYSIIGGEYHAQSADDIPTGHIYQEINKLHFEPELFHVENSDK